MSETVLQDFEVFKEVLIEENLESQIEMIQKINVLAQALGEKTTREELLPFIQQNFEEFHDEVLQNLSQQLKNCIPLVGGLEFSKEIFRILGQLCIQEETVVREAAVETLTAIQEGLTTQQIQEFLLPVINNLIQDDWFTSKCSVVKLFPAIYGKLSNEKQAEIRNFFKSLIQDDSPMVRKAAATTFSDFIAVVEEQVVKMEFIPIFQDIAQDPMDSVRSMAINIAIALVKRLEEDELESILKTIEAASDDYSWRMRQCLSNNIATLQELIPYGRYRGKLLALFQKLSQDNEPEVRVLAAINIYAYCEHLKNSYANQTNGVNNFEPVFEQSIMSVIQRLALDESEDVRLALSSNILRLSTILSEECFKRNIVTFLFRILRQEKAVAIQINFLLGLSNICDKIDLSQSLDAIKHAVIAVIGGSGSNWRARRSILKAFVDIARFCDPIYFSDNFRMYYVTLLGDPVFAVRRSASLLLPILSKRYGIKWASEHLIPHFTTFSRDTRYLYRFVALFGISEMVNPHICPPSRPYLKDFKALVTNKDSKENKKAILSLAKIVKTSHLIQKELKEEKYASILKLKEELDYRNNTGVYFEREFEELKSKNTNTNIYSLEPGDLEHNNWPYLQGILGLIYNKFMPIIEVLNRDSTENIQIKAVSTLSEISDFISRLNQEEAEHWVQESLKSITPAETAAIIDEIHVEFKTAHFQDKDLMEHIDTDIMDSSEEPDLSRTIYVDNSNKNENIDADKIERKVDNTVNNEILETLENNLSSKNDSESNQKGSKVDSRAGSPQPAALNVLLLSDSDSIDV